MLRNDKGDGESSRFNRVVESLDVGSVRSKGWYVAFISHAGGGGQRFPGQTFLGPAAKSASMDPQIFLPLSNKARIENVEPGSNPNNSARRRI
jgi:hypothetical protein